MEIERRRSAWSYVEWDDGLAALEDLYHGLPLYVGRLVSRWSGEGGWYMRSDRRYRYGRVDSGLARYHLAWQPDAPPGDGPQDKQRTRDVQASNDRIAACTLVAEILQEAAPAELRAFVSLAVVLGAAVWEEARTGPATA